MSRPPQIEVKRLPPSPWLVPITLEEEARWLITYGKIATLTDQDGRRWRVLEPWEDGAPR